MLTKTCEYAIRACLYIAQRTAGGGRLSIPEISQGTDTPETFVAKVLQTLRRHQLISSNKGPGGGFSMTEEQRRNSIADIVRAIEGDGIFHSCCLGLNACSDAHPCPVHEHYHHIRHDLAELMGSTTVASLLTDLQLQQTFLKN